MCYSGDVQRDLIECLGQGHVNKVRISKQYTNGFSQGIEEFRSYVKYRYRVIGRLISIEVLWESFHPNTPI